MAAQLSVVTMVEKERLEPTTWQAYIRTTTQNETQASVRLAIPLSKMALPAATVATWQVESIAACNHSCRA